MSETAVHVPNEPGHAYCPVHGDPSRPGYEWPCPVATEDDPPEAETCPHFAAELDRRMNEVKAGSYYELLPPDDSGQFRWQEYVDHKPVGSPEPL